MHGGLGVCLVGREQEEAAGKLQCQMKKEEVFTAALTATRGLSHEGDGISASPPAVALSVKIR